METGICEKDLELASKTDFILSLRTEAELKIGGSKTSRLKELANFASETWLRLTMLEKGCPDASLLAGSGSLKFRRFL